MVSKSLLGSTVLYRLVTLLRTLPETFEGNSGVLVSVFTHYTQH